MNDRQIEADWNDIDKVTYERSVKIFRSLKNLLKVNIKLHAADQIQQGDIFLFNHFSRFETFIPQFMIYEATGKYPIIFRGGLTVMMAGDYHSGEAVTTHELIPTDDWPFLYIRGLIVCQYQELDLMLKLLV